MLFSYNIVSKAKVRKYSILKHITTKYFLIDYLVGNFVSFINRMVKLVEFMSVENAVCYQKALSRKYYFSRKQSFSRIFMYFCTQIQESCQSGRMGLSRKQVNGKLFPGFESLTFRKKVSQKYYIQILSLTKSRFLKYFFIFLPLSVSCYLSHYLFINSRNIVITQLSQVL